MDTDHLFEMWGLDLVEIRDHPDTGVVHQDVEAAPRVHGRPDHFLSALLVGDAVEVGDRFATGCVDLGRHEFGVCGNDTPTVGPDSEIVHDDLCAARCQEHGMGAPQARVPASSRHDRDPTIEPEIAHGPPFYVEMSHLARQGSSSQWHDVTQRRSRWATV